MASASDANAKLRAARARAAAVTCHALAALVVAVVLGAVHSARTAADARPMGGTVFGYRVADPERYGVVAFDNRGEARQIIEKPEHPPSNYAVTGLYFLDGSAPARAARLEPSARGELEITSLLQMYLDAGELGVQQMGRGFAWLDTGTHGSLLDAGNFVRTLEQRQGLQMGSPDEIAFAKGWISRESLQKRAEKFSKTDYGDYLKSLLG